MCKNRLVFLVKSQDNDTFGIQSRKARISTWFLVHAKSVTNKSTVNDGHVISQTSQFVMTQSYDFFFNSYRELYLSLFNLDNAAREIVDTLIRTLVKLS